jgi:hypothetical protein
VLEEVAEWFREHVHDVHGIDLEDCFPPPEQVFDVQADKARLASAKV